MRRVVAYLCLACLSLASWPSTAIASNGSSGAVLKGLPSDVERAAVTNYNDGDKFEILLNGQKHEVNLIGADAPELNGGDLGECFAKDAADYIKKLLKKKQTVYLEKDKTDTDGKHRLLRYIWAANSTGANAYLLNELVISKGYASFKSKDGNTKYDDRLKYAQRGAQKREVGLWGACSGPHAEITPEPAATTSAPSGYTDDEKAYLTQVGKISSQVGHAVTDIGDRFQSNDIGSQDWTIYVAADFVAVRDGYQQALALTPPPAFADEHALFVQALSYANDATYDYQTGIDNVDAASIDAGNQALTQSATLINQANDELDRIRKEREG